MRLLATAAAFFALAGTAQAARTDDFAKPVLFIPAAQDCGVYDDMQAHLAEYSTSVGGVKIGMTGTMDAVGLYSGSGGCSATIGGAKSESVTQLGAKLAAYIADKKQVVDIVAEGQAGLVVRAAIAQTKALKVEDVVTLGTPHGGSDLARNPQGTGGTDWSVIASDGDTTVPVASATDMDAAHKTVYKAGSHSDLLTDVSDAMDAKIRYSHDAGKWVEWNNAPHPVNRVAENLIFGGGETTGACGLRETQPELCGKTPVILVPGFGASELECQSGGVKINTWPWALFEGSFWLRMALASDGRSPADPGNQCSRTVAPSGKAIDFIADLPLVGKIKIHESSRQWIERIAPGHGYVFGWDFRKGPDQTVGRLDKFIDEVRAKHGVSKVALVAHSYGGLLSRAYIDDDARARKVARVANFGSPFWGAPKAWFAMAYGYESPMASDLDNLTPNDTFKYFAKNLTGLYYLLPPQAWFDHAPSSLKYWLSVDDQWVRSPEKVADQIRAFKGNGALANEVAAYQAKHVSGFKRTNGVDWRIFVGSGLASLGHVRAYSGSDDVQYSWINGDGTVPLISQRQSATNAGPQLGDRTPTYHFCEIPHMEEMERELIQNQVTPFVVSGADPIKGGNGLRSEPCPLSETEFKVTGKEDAQSLALSRVVEATASRAGRAARAGAGTLSLDDAEAAGLVEVIRHAGRVTFVPNVPVVVHASGAGTLQTTPLTGEGKRGTSTVYDIPASGMDVTTRGTQAVAIAAGGDVLKGRKADTTPPKTKVRVRRVGARRMLTATAKDVSGVAVTMVQVGKARPKPWTKSLKVSKRATVRYWSVDTLGNAERHRKVKLR